MPHLDHKGPENSGSKTGRKLGNCKKTEAEKKEIGELGVGRGERNHSGGGKGKGKRLKYNESI